MPKNTKSEKVSVEVKPVEESKPAESKKSSKAQKATPVAEPEPTPVPVKASKKEKKTAVTEPVVEESKVEVAEVVKQEGGKRRTRYFRCMYGEDTFGRFSGFKPKQAAGKALTSILRHREKEGKDLFEEVTFEMVECTRGGSHKVSKYNGKRVKLEKPVTVTIKTGDGKKKEIKYNFTNKITKVKSEKKVAEKKATKKVTTKKTTTKKISTKKVAKKSAKKAVKKAVKKSVKSTA